MIPLTVFMFIVIQIKKTKIFILKQKKENYQIMHNIWSNEIQRIKPLIKQSWLHLNLVSEIIWLNNIDKRSTSPNTTYFCESEINSGNRSPDSLVWYAF